MKVNWFWKIDRRL